MDISKLRKISRNYEKMKLVVFEEVLKKCYKKIENIAYYNSKTCWFRIPDMIMGKPIYNMKACICFLMYKLIKKGFDVKYYDPNLLIISWKENNDKDYDEYLKKRTEGYLIDKRSFFL
jgi:hypothetical protein